LVNTLKARHPDLPQVATCDKNTQNKPIDGIVWCSPSLEILQAGMTGFGSPDVESVDHRMLWINISINSIFGYQPPTLALIQQAGIPMQNPEIGNRFNAALQKARNKHNIPNQIFWLEHRATAGLFDKDDAAPLYEHLTELDDELRDTCKKNIRKKYAGNVPFSDVIGNDRK
jgi:hypothetical protein